MSAEINYGLNTIRRCVCGGDMEFTERVRIIPPINLYKHTCVKCGKRERYKRMYPTLIYEDPT